MNKIGPGRGWWAFSNPPHIGKKTIDEYLRVKEELENLGDRGIGKYNLKHSFAIPYLLGKMGKPKIVSESEYIKEKGITCYRAETGKTFEESISFSREMRKNEPEDCYLPTNGGAIFGVGIYSGTNKQEIISTYGKDINSYIDEFKLKEDAKIVSYEIVNKKRGEINKLLGEKLGKDVNDFWMMDPGNLASLMGADAITTPQGYVVVLNRSKIICKEI